MTLPFDAGGAVVGITANRHLCDGVHREWLRRRYIDALERHACVECVILPTIDGDFPRDETVGKLRSAMRRLDGLVLTGDESNLDPAIFDEQGRAWNRTDQDVIPGERDRPRDRLSCAALAVAVELDMPILGICRGLQEMSVYRNGTLHAELAHVAQGIVHSENPALPRDEQYLPVHSVEVAPGGWLSSICVDRMLHVNSLHNQGITVAPGGTRLEALAEDGVVEALSYSTSAVFQFAVQWHPEWHAATDVTSRKIFAAFGHACHAYRSTGQSSK